MGAMDLDLGLVKTKQKKKNLCVCLFSGQNEADFLVPVIYNLVKLHNGFS